MGLSAEQQRILNRIKTIGRQVGASPKEVKAAVETGLVESGLRNLKGGDADSAGWRQERGSIYKDPTNLDASIKRFFGETRGVRGKYGSAGDLAAAVQRPAAQYRGRYQQQQGRAAELLGRPSGPTIPGVSPTPSPTAAAPVDTTAQRGALLSQYLATRGRPGALAGLGGGLEQLRQTAAQAATTPAATPGPPQDRAAVGEQLAQFASRADTINAKHLPYQWGGGHGGKVNPRTAAPLDCSGAVSAVLGINPRVSGDFTKWGKPGEGDGKGVVVYANDKHVLMSIGGKMFGTSASNPGGGAGWIPRGQLGRDYLKNFTARHL
jgi:hypothetical protein